MKTSTDTLLRDLGNGLVLRRATPGDAEPLAAFEAKNMHFPMGFHIQEWLRGDHPTNGAEHFTIVEDTATGAIVSAACLIPQTFLYEQVPFFAGRAEAVATDPAYRRRGLVRLQFDTLHAWADEQGQMAQVVEGATWLYRRIGYALAMENTGGMNSGGRICHRQQAPQLPGGQEEPYLVRAAGTADLPFIVGLYEQSRARYAVSSREPLAHFEYVLRGGSDGFNKWFDLRVIEDAAGGGKPVGFVMHDPWGCGCVLLYEVAPGASWLAVTPSVLRYLFEECGRIARADGGDCQTLRFCFASEHPVYAVAPHYLSEAGHPYAGWLVRVPDLPRFLDHIKAALNERLVGSLLGAHTGEMKLNFYDHGAALQIESGRVTGVTAWTPKDERDGDATFTTEAFMPLLFGLRRLAQVRANDADCWVASNDAQVLLDALFPQKHSHLGPLA